MRFPSVDILRSVAIVVMVLVHFAENLSGVALRFAGLGAPMFAILSGISYRLWLNGQLHREVPDDEISKISIRRGLFVFGVGFAFNILVWLPEDTFNWDVLTFIGVAILILNLTRHLPISINVLSAGMILFITPFLQAMAGYSEYWVNGYFECDMTLPDVLIGFFITGYFPLFPWVMYSLTGFATATVLFPPHLPTREQISAQSVRPLILLGISLLITGVLLLQVRNFAPPVVSTYLLTGWTMFPSSWEYVLCTVGMAFTLFGILHHTIDRRDGLNGDAGLFRITKVFSRYAFTIYLLHHMVHLWPLWIYGYCYGSETTEFWRTALPLTASLSLAVLFLSICYLILSRINPDKRYGVEGWMRWLCG